MLKTAVAWVWESVYVHDSSMQKAPSVALSDAPKQDQSPAERAPHSSKYIMEGLLMMISSLNIRACFLYVYLAC